MFLVWSIVKLFSYLIQASFLQNSFKNEPRPKLHVNTQVLPIPYYTKHHSAPACKTLHVTLFSRPFPLPSTHLWATAVWFWVPDFWPSCITAMWMQHFCNKTMWEQSHCYGWLQPEFPCAVYLVSSEGTSICSLESCVRIGIGDRSSESYLSSDGWCLHVRWGLFAHICSTLHGHWPQRL